MEAREVLVSHNLKSTTCRNEVLNLLLNSSQALAQSEIEKQVDHSHDRVTVYRTLKTFLDKGLVHKVLDDEGGTKYALCNECAEDHHNHEHVHFKCENCGQTLCLDKIAIPAIELPQGYNISEKNLLIQGTCKDCS
ncbi:Fur family transcriptional regulator [Fulvivirga lutea]|uniref:Transcriptional repressor n=1 Tax=Fulvivirga lutea TaxID=2810512 RepID=A0A975A231_9BACT|nr:transcriptional repressor [Fulvivirga lutea]QSE98112.1 transcriptional repressor [Fulvivirga lutea]